MNYKNKSIYKNMDLFFVHMIGVILVLLSYLYYIPKIKSVDLWVGIPSNLRILFIIFIAIAVSCFIVGARLGGNDSRLIWGFILFYLGSALWTPSVYYDNRYAVLIALCLTTLGALLLTTWSPQCFFFLIVLLHVLIMDNIIWYGYYLEHDN
jgi:hypothetical protein